MGASETSGRTSISGLIKPGDSPPGGGLDPMDVVSDGKVRFGFPNIWESGEIVELALAIARGEPTTSKVLGHAEFMLTYKKIRVHRAGLPTRSRRRPWDD